MEEMQMLPSYWATIRKDNILVGTFLLAVGAAALACGNYENGYGGVLFVSLFILIPALVALGYGLWAHKKYKEAIRRNN
jgi:hypothetical protein